MPRCSRCFRRLLDGARCPAHREAALVDRELDLDEPPVPIIPGYTLHRRLGAGGFAQVYAASCDVDGEPVALKIALLARDWRFPREAEALRRVRAPHAPRLIELGVAGDHPFIAMELVAGRSLASWLAGQLDALPPQSEAVNVLRAVCETVDAIHRVGLIHRDLKPENLILSGLGATAIDFGLAREPGAPSAEEIDLADLTRTGERLGTPAYMAPEQCLGSTELDFAADVYAVAVMAYELFCGRPPFVGSGAEVQQAHVVARPPPPSSLGDLPVAVDAVFFRALAKSPGERHSTAGHLLSEITAALKDRGGNESSREIGRRRRPASRARRGLVALLAVESRAPVERIQEAASLEDGELVRARADFYVIAFPRAVSLESGIRAAVNLAGRLEEMAEWCVAHVALLRIKDSARGLVALGRDLDRVDAWIPARRDGGGLLLTEAAAAELRESCVESPVDGFYRWAPGGVETAELARTIELRGRGRLLETLLAEAGHSRDRGMSVVSTVLGDSGSGKSRLLEALASSPHLDKAQRLHLSTSFSSGASVLASLLRFALGISDLADRPAVSSAVRALLGRDDDALVDSLVLGEPSDVPPAIRSQLLARVIAEGLSRRAGEAWTVVLVDDAHLAEAAVLDGLEQATAARGAALWLLVTAGRELEALRPSWGERAAMSSRHALEPLEPDAATAMLLDLLSPAEFIPEAIVARLVELCEGIPLNLVQVAQVLRAEGRVRRLRGTESFYVDTDDLLRVSATPLAERLAERALRTLPPSLVALTRVAAILEHGISAEAVEAVASEISDLDELDPGAGLAKLARIGLLFGRDGVYEFRSSLVCQAVRGTTPAEWRQKLHAAAVAYLEARGGLAPPDLARLAGHAAACGMRERAAELYLDLGEQALAALDAVNAERHFTAALGQLGEAPTETRQRALAQRGRARGRSRDLAGGVEDLRQAQTIAEVHGDTAALVEYLLEEATLSDWAFDLASAEALVTRAVDIANDLKEPRLAVRCALGLGRSHFRAERNDPAVDELSRAVDQARTAGDYETEVMALLLLGPALTYCHRFDEAELVFEQAIRLCEQAGDVVHLGAAYGNRVVLWEARQYYEQGLEDLRRSLACARTAGRPKIELGAEHNLAELLLWMGRLDDAARSAARTRELVDTYLETPILLVHLLPVRIACARGELDEARELLASIEETFGAEEVAPTDRVLLEAVRLRCSEGGSAGDWEAIIDQAVAGSWIHASLEITHLGISALLDAGDLDGARKLLARAEELEPPQLWRDRFAELAARLPQ